MSAFMSVFFFMFYMLRNRDGMSMNNCEAFVAHFPTHKPAIWRGFAVCRSVNLLTYIRSEIGRHRHVERLAELEIDPTLCRLVHEAGRILQAPRREHLSSICRLVVFDRLVGRLVENTGDR